MNALAFDAHHLWDGRTTDINVHDADLARPVLRQRVRQLTRKGALANAALARQDDDLVSDARKAIPN